MNTQMIICMVIFAATLVSYMLNKIPMWLTAMISLAALYFTGCIDASGALAGFSNVNTLLMATMFVVAAGFRRTSLVDGMCDAIMKVTRGSFRTAYFGYILLAVLLTNFIASPMVVYAIVSPLLAALCDNTGHSRSQYMFPVMVVCVACCGILPLATAIQQAGQFTGFMETYGFTGMSMRAIDFTIGTWPVLIIVPLWAVFIGPKFTPKEPVVPIEALEQKSAAKGQQKLSRWWIRSASSSSLPPSSASSSPLSSIWLPGRSLWWAVCAWSCLVWWTRSPPCGTSPGIC